MAGTSVLSIIIRALDEFSGEVQRLKDTLGDIGPELENIKTQSDESAKSLTGMAMTATAFQQLGTRLAGVGAILSATMIFPVKAAAEFERALSRVAAVTDDAIIGFTALERTASELGRTTRYTAREAAEGMRYLGMAGFNAAQTMAAIGPALTLAAAGNMDLSRAADISTNIMTAMRIPVEELAHVIDVLAKTSTSSNTSVVQMSEALKYTAPLAQSAGVSLEQTAAAIGVLGNNGIQACFDINTEVLTQEGWKTWEDVTMGDRMGTMNPVTHKLEWQHPIRLYKYQYSGKMYRLETPDIDLCVTPNHRMWVSLSSHSNFGIFTAEDIYGKAVKHHLAFYDESEPQSTEFKRSKIISNKNEEVVEEWSDYDDEVFCAEVPNTLLIVRRNGKAIVSGNSLAGTSLRGMLISLASPTKRARDTLAEMGVVIARNEDATINFVETLRRFRDANIDLADANNLFLRRSAAGAVALSHQVDEVERLTNANIMAVRSGKEMYTLMEDNLIGAIIRLTSAFNGLMRSIGQPFLDILKKNTLGLANMLDKIAGFISDTPILTKLIGYLTIALGSLFLTLGLAAGAFATLITVTRGWAIVKLTHEVTALTAVLVKFKVAVIATGLATSRIGAIAGSLIVSLRVIKRLIVALASALVASKFALVISGIGAAFGGLIIYFALIHKSIQQQIDENKRLVSALSAVETEYQNLQNALKTLKKDSEEFAEVSLKLRKFLVETADSQKELRNLATEAALSIDLLTGSIDDGGAALERFNQEVRRLRLDALIKQVRLYSREMDKLSGSDFWANFFSFPGHSWAITKELFAKMLFLEKSYLEERDKEMDIARRVQQEKFKAFSAQLFTDLYESGQIDLNFTDSQMAYFLEEWGITSKEAIDLVLKEWEKFKNARTRISNGMLDETIYKNNAEVESTRKAVNEQIIELRRLEAEKRKYMSVGDFVMKEYTEDKQAEARLLLQEATKAYDQALFDAQQKELEKRMSDYDALYTKYASVIAKINQKIADGTIVIDDETNTVTKGRDPFGKLTERQKYFNQKLFEMEEKINEDTIRLRNEKSQEIVNIEADRINEVQRMETQLLITQEDAELEKRQIRSETALAQVQMLEDELKVAQQHYQNNEAMLEGYHSRLLAAERNLANRRQEGRDYEERLANKYTDQEEKRILQAAKRRVMAEEDSLRKIEKLRDLDIEIAKRNYSQWAKDMGYLDQEIEEIKKRAIVQSNEFIRKQEEKKQRFIIDKRRHELDLARMVAEEELSVARWHYNQGIISLEAYYDKRRKVLAKKIDDELELLRLKLAVASSDEEKAAIQARIEVKTQEKDFRLAGEDREREDERIQNERAIQTQIIDIRRKAVREWEFTERQRIEKDAFKIRQDQELAAFERRNQELFSDGTEWAEKLTEFKNLQEKEHTIFVQKQIDDRYEYELEKRKLMRKAEEEANPIEPWDFEGRLRAELDAFIENQKAQLEAFLEFEHKKEELSEFMSNQKIARMRKEAEIERAILWERMKLNAGILGDMSDVFGAVYDASGGKLKEFANMQKALAVVQTTILAIQAAQEAYTRLAGYPIAAAAAAAAALAAGMSRVQQIQAQNFAEGGKVKDSDIYIRSKKDEEVPIAVTAKEWKFPKKRVQEYGVDFFEAIRTKSIPKTLTELLVKRKEKPKVNLSARRYGEIKGHSPHNRADNIRTTGKPGDFILPVDSARHYGRDFMTAVLRGYVPSDWSDLKSPKIHIRLDEGGEIDFEDLKQKKKRKYFLDYALGGEIDPEELKKKKILPDFAFGGEIDSDDLKRKKKREPLLNFALGGKIADVEDFIKNKNKKIKEFKFGGELTVDNFVFKKKKKQGIQAFSDGGQVGTTYEDSLFKSLQTWNPSDIIAKKFTLPSINIPKPQYTIQRFSEGGKVTSYERTREGAAPAAGTINVHVPISVQAPSEDTERLRRSLQTEVERTVIRIVKEHSR